MGFYKNDYNREQERNSNETDWPRRSDNKYLTVDIHIKVAITPEDILSLAEDMVNDDECEMDEAINLLSQIGDTYVR